MRALKEFALDCHLELHLADVGVGLESLQELGQLVAPGLVRALTAEVGPHRANKAGHFAPCQDRVQVGSDSCRVVVKYRHHA